MENQLSAKTETYWNIISQLNTPWVRALWKFIAAFTTTGLALFEGTPRVFIPVAFLVLGSIVGIEYSRDVLGRRQIISYLNKIEPIMIYTLRMAEVVLKEKSEESLQLTVMLVEDNWHPRYRLHFQGGKHRVPIKRGAAWMSYVDLGQTKAFVLHEELKDQLLEAEDKLCFRDVSAVLVSPIYSPNTPDNLIGALVVYSNEGDNSILLRDKKRCEDDVVKINSEFIAPILCYHHICQ